MTNTSLDSSGKFWMCSVPVNLIRNEKHLVVISSHGLPKRMRKAEVLRIVNGTILTHQITERDITGKRVFVPMTALKFRKVLRDMMKYMLLDEFKITIERNK